MIYRGVHPITQRERTVAECDAPGCDRSEFLPNDAGVNYGADLMSQVGWEVGSGRFERPALCPDHVTAPVQCPHPERERVMLGYRATCGRCGRAVSLSGVAAKHGASFAKGGIIAGRSKNDC